MRWMCLLAFTANASIQKYASRTKDMGGRLIDD